MSCSSHLYLLVFASVLQAGVIAQLDQRTLPDCTIDSHTHFVNISKIKYKPQQKYGKSYFPSDYAADTRTSGTPSSVVFIEVFAEPEENFREAMWVQQLAESQHTPSIAAIVAYAPVENGYAVAPTIRELKRQVPLLAGIRRALLDDAYGQQYSDACWFMRNRSFVEGLEVLAANDLVFELGIRRSSQFDCSLELVKQAPRNLTIVIEHLGATNMTDPTEFAQWKEYVSALAKIPNTVMKIGGVPERAVSKRPYDSWTEEQVTPWILHALAEFGFRRSMFDGNWFVVSLFSTFERWAEVLGRILQKNGAQQSDLTELYCSTATRTYLKGDNAKSSEQIGLGQVQTVV